MSGAADTEDDLVDAFKVFDKDNDGFITHDELRQVMKQLGKFFFEIRVKKKICTHLLFFTGQKLSEEEVNEMIKEADGDNDGKIDYKEFSKMMVK